MDATQDTPARTNVVLLTEDNFAQFENEMTAYLDTRMLGHQMPADILTKALPRQKLDAARKMLGLVRSFSEFVPHLSLFSQLCS
ncbi:hypothetical protein AURDEDRAFT_171050 [Auricularia subglabra TFB-10046 SS5]|nr:hypothetical protein AURDEDRAFT_171050 [Auricularia subglabra TFB-10046 SS5]